MNRSKSILRRILHSPVLWAVCICFVSFSLTALAVSGFLPQEDDSTYYASSRAVIVNINEADISELSLLDGIGYERAKEIVRYRQSHGAFSCAEDIMDVPGIGEGIYRRIRNQIKV
ncbi:MAG: helix-hairpin-helix domain-containing protein [Oscillospiraceae bacterium]|nr:helix-hairpin-helix domain-containing protein [Oscillospiraceae bacterium]MDY3064345.1 helix-hairpin-helix domain-containing protein [Oscillospiraceae bacterium]